ncbi:MAG: class I SAM-dependent methyltransferase [Sulfuritalea sp.]|nr:class I SAM-dependent methyltransferase [Sulfuritalea sp.]
MSNPLILQLHGHDIFEGFDPMPFPEDPEGWNSRHPVLKQVLEVKKPAIVVEVGVWKGASTLFMAEIMRAQQIGGTVIAIDTFLGSLEHVRDPQSWASMNSRHGWPNIYFQFLANVVRADLQNHVCPLPQTADIACQLLSSRGIRPGMVHIDGSHDHASVMRDLENYFALLEPGGVLVGDDFVLAWPEVVWAATEFAKRYGLALQHSAGKFVIEKPRN